MDHRRRRAAWEKFNASLAESESLAMRLLEEMFRRELREVMARVSGGISGVPIGELAAAHPIRAIIQAAQRSVRGWWLTKMRVILVNTGKKFAVQTAVGLNFRFPGFAEEVQRWIDDHLPKLADTMDNTTLEKIESQVVEGIKQGENLRQVEIRIQNAYNNFIRSRPQAIARTETGMVASLAQKATIDKLPIPKSQLQKTWSTSLDERVRDWYYTRDGRRTGASHVDLEDETVPYTARFSNGLMFPREPGGPPEEIINCRCTQIVERIAS